MPFTDRPSMRGNIFTVLLGGVLLAGALGVMTYQTISGPLAGMTRVTRTTAAGIQSAALAKALLLSAKNEVAADCDADGTLEPPEWESESLNWPANGGKIPYAVAPSVQDPWGQRYGYCVWDTGATIGGVGGANNPGCMAGGGARLAGAPNPLSGPTGLQTVMALISPGPDRAFQTGCKTYATAVGDGSNDLIDVPAGSDDIVTRYSYQEASFAAGDLWALSDAGPQTAAIDKALNVTASDTTAPAIRALAVVAEQSVTATGGLLLSDQNRIASCNAGNMGLLRYNTGSGDSVSVRTVTDLKKVKAATTTDTVSFPTLPAAHDTIIVPVTGRATGGVFAVTAVTDNQGNTYSLVGSDVTAGGTRAAIYAAYDIAAPSGTFTITMQYGGGASRAVSFGALAVSGLEQTANNADVTGTISANNSTPLTVTSTGSAPTTQANTFALALHAYQDSTGDVNVAYGAAGGWTQVLVNNNAFEYAGFSAVYKVLSAAGVPSHAWAHHAHGASGEYVMAALATFRGATDTSGTPSVSYCDGTFWREIGDSILPQVTNIDSLYDGATDYGAALTCTLCNVGLGENAAPFIFGSANTAIGHRAIQAASSGNNNTAMGYAAGNSISSSVANTVIGSDVQSATGSFGAAGVGSTGVGASALAANTASSGATAFGYQALKANTTGVNVAFGKDALLSNTTGSFLSAFGYHALRLNFGASNSTAGGYQALQANTGGANNTAFGYQALGANVTGSGNTAFGYQALPLFNGGGFAYQTAFGYQALSANTNGSGNTAFGHQALKDSSSGVSNAAAGSAALRSVTVGSSSSAAGYQALMTDSLGSNNAAAGYQALRALLNASSNTAAGYQALTAHITPGGATAIGYRAMATDTTGQLNTAVGYQALVSNTIGTGNTAVSGRGALSANTTGSSNTAIGLDAAAANTTSGDIVALGVSATRSRLTGNTGAVALGGDALTAMTAGGTVTAVGSGAFASAVNVGSNNTGIGAQVCGAGTNLGNDNTYYSPAMGAYACNGGTQNTGAKFAEITSGVGNTGTGPKISTGSYNTGDYGGAIGSYNTGMGYLVLQGFTATPPNVSSLTAAGYAALSTAEAGAANNTALGALAMQGSGGASTATGSTAFGNQALLQMRTGLDNTAVGAEALKGSEPAGGTGMNTVVGYQSMPFAANGTGSTVVGALSGVSNGLNSSNNTFIGYLIGTILVNGSNYTAAGDQAIAVASDTMRFGASGSTVYTYGTYTSTSDRRMKKDIAPSALGLDFIMRLRPVSYRMRKGDGGLDYGFIAQEVQEALGDQQTNMVYQENDQDQLWQIGLGHFVAPLVKAVQERQVAIDRQAQEIKDLSDQISLAEKALAHKKSGK